MSVQRNFSKWGCNIYLILWSNSRSFSACYLKNPITKLKFEWALRNSTSRGKVLDKDAIQKSLKCTANIWRNGKKKHEIHRTLCYKRLNILKLLYDTGPFRFVNYRTYVIYFMTLMKLKHVQPMKTLLDNNYFMITLTFARAHYNR